MHQPLADGCRATRVRQQMAQYRSKPQHQRHMPQQIADAILADVTEFQGAKDRFDDETIIVLSVR